MSSFEGRVPAAEGRVRPWPGIRPGRPPQIAARRLSGTFAQADDGGTPGRRPLRLVSFTYNAGARVVVTISAASVLAIMRAPPPLPPPPPPPPSLVRTSLIASQARPVRSLAASHIPDRLNAAASNPGLAVLETTRSGVLRSASHSAVNSAARPCTIARIRSLWPDARGSDVKTPGASATGLKELLIIFSPLIPRFGVV